MIQKLLKNYLGRLQCFRFGIKNHGKNIYIGVRTKIIGGQNIYLGNNVQIRHDCFLACNENAKLIINDGVDLGERSRVCCALKIKIGQKVLTGPNVFITDHDHGYTDIKSPIIEQNIIIRRDVLINDDSFCGTNVVIMGCTIGKHCVIGANSVVTKDIPDYSVVVGAPAKIIKNIISHHE